MAGALKEQFINGINADAMTREIIKELMVANTTSHSTSDAVLLLT